MHRPIQPRQPTLPIGSCSALRGDHLLRRASGTVGTGTDRRVAGRSATPCIFYLGTHEPGWLARVRFPLFVSHRRLARYRRLPVARCRWALDSGAFSELSLHGRWTLTPAQYVAAVRRYRAEVTHLSWAAPQDWMCEPFIVARTGLSVLEHQRRTVANVMQLRALAPDLPIIPVLQGWQVDDYVACVAMYADGGIDLTKEPLVGLGSVCRRQATDEIAAIVIRLHELGLRLHGFGVKTEGLRQYGRYLVSADSMAWSLRGRFERGCRHRAPAQRVTASEANCLPFAREWRSRVLASTHKSRQVSGGHDA
jgi:hypothetical protein